MARSGSQSKSIKFDRKGSGRVTLKHVADHAGVSVGTVSDIVNRGRANLYTPEKQQRVLASIEALGYRAVRAAQDLRRGWSNNAGVILTHSFENPYYARLFNTLKNALEQHDLAPEMTVVDSKKPVDFQNAWQRALSHGVSGLIIGPLYYWDEELIMATRELAIPSIPVITFGSVGKIKGVESIVLPDRVGGEIAAEHLIERGHRRISFLGAYAESEVRLGRGTMQEGFESNLRDRQRFDRRWFIQSPDSGKYETAYADALTLADRWLAAGPEERPTAVMCKTDQLAIAALAAMHAKGIGVPSDLSIMGYDNVPESGYTVPALTTVDGAMPERMSEIAVRLAHLMGGGAAKDRPIALPSPKLVRRDSVAPPSTD